MVSDLINALCQKPETCFIATFESQQGRIKSHGKICRLKGIYATDSVTNGLDFI